MPLRRDQYVLMAFIFWIKPYTVGTAPLRNPRYRLLPSYRQDFLFLTEPDNLGPFLLRLVRLISPSFNHNGGNAISHTPWFNGFHRSKTEKHSYLQR